MWLASQRKQYHLLAWPRRLGLQVRWSHLWHQRTPHQSCQQILVQYSADTNEWCCAFVLILWVRKKKYNKCDFYTKITTCRVFPLIPEIKRIHFKVGQIRGRWSFNHHSMWKDLNGFSFEWCHSTQLSQQGSKVFHDLLTQQQVWKGLFFCEEYVKKNKKKHC